MKLLTAEIKKKAEKQYTLGADMDKQQVVAKYFDPCGSWTWYLMNIDPENNMGYAWGIVSGFEVETGSFSLQELSEFKGKMGIGIERDLWFKPMPATEVWQKLLAGEHI